MNDRPGALRQFSTFAPNISGRTEPLVQELQDAPPVFWAPLERSWVVHRFKEVNAVLCDRNFHVAELSSIVEGICSRSGKPAPVLTGLLSAFLPFINPPGHELSRQYLRAVLSAQRAASYAPALESIANTLLQAVPPCGSFDAATGYADLLPSLFIGHFLGIEGDTVVNFVQQTAEIGRTFDRGCSPRYFARMEALISAERAPFLPLVAKRRERPDESGLSRMIALADALCPMPDAVIADHVMFLIMAASENTAALIGNAIVCVMQAGLIEPLRTADDTLFRAAVEETLRFATPVRQMWRIATTDLCLGEANIRAGDRLLLLTGAAGRDPSVYPDPDRFDPWRTNRRSFGFGLGHHYCLGAELALLEAEIALKQILRRHPRLDPERPVSWRDRQTLLRTNHIPLYLSPERDHAHAET